MMEDGRCGDIQVNWTQPTDTMAPSLPMVEQTLRQNRSQLMRLPVVHCAQSYLGSATINQLRKEIGLLAV